MAGKLKTYDDVEAAVAAANGVKTFEMWELRDVQGAGKLGRYVAAAISEGLADKGLGHYPEELPISQYERARVFKRKSAVGRLLAATNSLTEDADETLRSVANNQAEDVVQKIRELVCE